MTFAPSCDYRLIRFILTSGKSYSRMANDAAPEIGAFLVEAKPGVEYVLAWDKGRALAVFLLVAHRPFEAEVHFCFALGTLGVTPEVTSAFLDWVWRHRNLNRLIALVPSYNRFAMALAAMTDFRKFETQGNAGTRKGQPFDLVRMELKRPISGLL